MFLDRGLNVALDVSADFFFWLLKEIDELLEWSRVSSLEEGINPDESVLRIKGVVVSRATSFVEWNIAFFGGEREGFGVETIS